MASVRIVIILISFVLLAVNGGVSAAAAAATVVLEEGYSVTTLIDANKIGFNPHSILPRFASSDFVLLDSSRSDFYTLSSPISQESVVERLAGNGTAGFADGDLGSAVFNSPKSFAIDFKGNVYVADKGNHVIRKITRSGVTTIAGGSLRKAGYVDGPAQQAQFSDDFDLTFAPGMCALLICDHGNNRIRQIDLKREDCQVASPSALGATYIWILGMGIACILGVIIGFVARPYIISHDGFRLLSLTQIWKIFRINQGKQVVTFCFDIRNGVANSAPYLLLRKFILLNLSYLSRILTFTFVKPESAHVNSVSLMDSDVVSSETDGKQLDKFASQLKDLIVFDGREEPQSSRTYLTPDLEDLSEVSSHSTLDTMIHANLMDLETKLPGSTLQNSVVPTSGLLRRRHDLSIQKQGS